MNTMTVTIDMDKRCAECGKGGATDSGICMKCASNALRGKKMKSAAGKVVQDRLLAIRLGIKK